MLTIFKASAGSGKTFTLSASYIAHMISNEVDHPHKHQLAVTFTNKATAEMKERILQYLFSISHSNDDHNDFFQAVRKLVPERFTNRMIRQRTGQILQEIIHDYDHFRVTTIDSFFQSLLSNLAHELNLSAGFKVELGDSDVLSKAVDRLLTNLEDHTDELNWLTDYIQQRLQDDKGWNVGTDLKNLAKELLKEDYMIGRKLLHLSEQPDQDLASQKGYVDLTSKVIKAYRDTLHQIEKAKRKELAEKASSVDHIIETTLGYTNISNGTRSVKPFIAKAMDEKTKYKDVGKPSATFIAYAEGTKSMLKKDDLGNQTFLCQEGRIQQELFELVDKHEEIAITMNSCALSLKLLNPLRLLDAIDKEVTALNRENDRFMLANTPLLFHDLTGENDASFIFERAGSLYHHIMIDEFQDTSRLQWDNMRELLVENLSQGNTCMLVGDVKQGIYRWRGGDWSMLAGFKNGYDQSIHTNVNIETLKTNFRSGENIVMFNNDLFVQSSAYIDKKIRNIWEVDEEEWIPESKQVGSIYPIPDPENDIHEVTQLTKDPGGFVRVEFINAPINDSSDKDNTSSDTTGKKAEKSEEKENIDSLGKEKFNVEEAVAQQMLRLNEIGVPFDEMAILIRTKSEAQPLLSYFEKNYNNRIPLISEEAFLLESSPAVQIIINSLRYISNKTDGIALAYVRNYYPEGKKDEIEALLKLWNEQHYSGLPFYEITNRLVNLFELHTHPGQSPYLYAFLDAILNYIEDNTADVKQFLQYWDEKLHNKSIPSAAVKGVRILTIHKAKGLAFHSVFLPYCDWVIEDSRHTSLKWVQPEVSPYNAIPLIPVEMRAEADKSIYSDVYRQEQFDTYIENLNLMYVAFTRPIQNLIIWSDCEKNKSSISEILYNALQQKGYEGVSNGKLLTIEVGEPSSLKLKDSDTSEKMEKSRELSSCDEQKAISNPLDFSQKEIEINFELHNTPVTFMQSNNARRFIEEEQDLESGENTEDTQESKDLQESYRLTGILLHELLACIETADEAEKKIEDFAREGLLPKEKSAEWLKKLLQQRMQHPLAKQWFDGSWELYRECSIVFREKIDTPQGPKTHMVTKRPDRVMMRGNIADGTDETIVIDFKFGRFKTEHREQVSQYMDLLRQQGRHHVRGYLWYLYTGSIEEVEGIE